MKNIFKALLLLIALFFLTTCKKTAPTTLPPATQTGANTFGCKVNGEVWVPYFQCNYLGNPCSEMQVDFLQANPNYVLPIAITLNTRREQNGKSSYFSILTKKIQFPPHTYIQHPGNIYDSLDIEFIDENRGGLVGGVFDKIYGAPGNFEITKLDTLNKIISGVFNFTLSNGTDSIMVTEGRFDFQLQSLCKCSK